MEKENTLQVRAMITVLRLFSLLLCMSVTIGATSFASACAVSHEECIEPGGMREIDGHKVTRSCWRKRTIYRCPVVHAESPSCGSLDPNICHVSGQDCVRYGMVRGERFCVSERKTYQCQSSDATEVIVDPDHPIEGAKSLLCQVACKDEHCKHPSAEMNDELAATIGQLEILKGIKDVSDKENMPGIKLFGGETKACSKKYGAFSDCCKDGGWGKNLGAKCKADEIALIDAAQKKRCVYVGRRCEEKVAVCTVEKKVFCCFPSVLSRLLQAQGRAQLGKNFGSASDPSCGGLTIAEIERIDFSKMNFQDFLELEVAPRLQKTQAKTNNDYQILAKQSMSSMKERKMGSPKMNEGADE